jgi:hypothetical protein
MGKGSTSLGKRMGTKMSEISEILTKAVKLYDRWHACGKDESILHAADILGVTMCDDLFDECQEQWEEYYAQSATQESLP